MDSIEISLRKGALPQWIPPRTVDNQPIPLWIVCEKRLPLMADDRLVRAIRIETDEQQALSELTTLAEDILSRHNLLGLRLWHAYGDLSPNQTHLRIGIAAIHAQQASLALEELLDAKHDRIPIWQQPLWD